MHHFNGLEEGWKFGLTMLSCFQEIGFLGGMGEGQKSSKTQKKIGAKRRNEEIDLLGRGWNRGSAVPIAMINVLAQGGTTGRKANRKTNQPKSHAERHTGLAPAVAP